MTNKTIEQMQRQIELYINEQAADVQVFRVTLQSMFLTMFATNPHKREAVGGLRELVLRTLRNPLPDPSIDPTDAAKRTQLTVMRGEQFFAEIEAALGISGSTAEPSSRND